jgi:hypothetical protein
MESQSSTEQEAQKSLTKQGAQETRCPQQLSSASCACYGLMLVIAVGFYGVILPAFRPYPYADEWVYQVPFSFESGWAFIQWAFVQHVDHRIPIQKVLQFAILRASGFDFRYVVGLNFALAMVLCAMLLSVAKMYRGRQSFSDLIFPLATLSFGAGFSLWGFQFAFLSSTFFVSGFLFLAVCYERSKRMYQLNMAIVCLLLCSFCGLNGMVMSSGLTLVFLIYLSFEALRSKRPGKLSTYSLIAAVLFVNIILWKSWSPSSASNLAHFDPVEFSRFLFGLLPAAFVIFAFSDVWWKDAFIIALLLGASFSIWQKLVQRRWGLSDTVLTGTILVTLFLVASISGGRNVGTGGWNSVLCMHYGYLTIFIPLLSWILVSSGDRTSWKILLGVVSVFLFAWAFQTNAVWRWSNVSAVSSHQKMILQELARGTKPDVVTDRFLLDFTWKDEPVYRQEVAQGISTFRDHGYTLYGPASR